MTMGYQPTYPPYIPAYPARNDLPMNQGYQPAQNSTQAQQMASGGFLCRPVTSREEAVAAQIDFMGPGTIMPDLGHGVIYMKRFNTNTGASDFYQFVLQAPPKEQDTSPVAFATLQDFLDLQSNVQDLKDEIEQLKKPNGKAVKKNDANE